MPRFVAVVFASSVVASGIAGAGDQDWLKACHEETARQAEVPVTAVRTDQEVAFADGSSLAKLDAGMAGGVCWADAKGKVTKVALAEPKSDVDAAKATACAGAASKAKGVPASDARAEWWSVGPDGIAWIRLQVKGEKADCLVDAKGGVKEVVFDVPR